MDFERAVLLLNVIHMSVGVPEAAEVAKAASMELSSLAKPAAPPAPPAPAPKQMKLDLSGKPKEE